jgi:hypothetical protein
MGEQSGGRQHRFEDRTSDIAWLIELPRDPPTLKLLLRRFLVVLSELVERLR